MIITIAGRREATAGLLVAGALAPVGGEHEISGRSDAPDVAVILDASDRSASLLASLPASALVVAYADDADVAAQLATTGARVVTVGLSPASDLRATDIDTSLEGTRFTAVGGDAVSVPVTTAIVGESVVPLVLAALAVAIEAGTDATAAAAALAPVTSAPFDMSVSHRSRGLVVIDDTIDGTPASVSAALKALAQATTDGTRSVAVLGELDLDGETDPTEVREAHDRIGRLVVRLNVSKLIVVGTSARHIHNAAGLEGSWDGESILVDTVEEALEALAVEGGNTAGPAPGVVVLVKPSATADLRLIGNRIGTVNA